jgi:hypothetical protein
MKHRFFGLHITSQKHFIFFSFGVLSFILLLVSITFIRTPRSIQTTLIEGGATLINSTQATTLIQGLPYTYFPGETLTIDQQSTILLTFQNGKSITITDPSSLTYTIHINTSYEPVFMFRDGISGYTFQFNQNNGLQHTNASVLSQTTSGKSSVLGIYETIPTKEGTVLITNQVACPTTSDFDIEEQTTNCIYEYENASQ